MRNLTHRGWLLLPLAAAALLVPPARASELEAKFNGQFVHLLLEGRYLEYIIERKPAGADGFEVLDYNQTGCTEACTYDDFAIQAGEAYDYQIWVILPDGVHRIFGPARVEIDRKTGLSLGSYAAPNPLGPETLLHFSIPATLAGQGEIPVTIQLIDAMGRRVRALWSGSLRVGAHVLPLEARDDGGRSLPTGTYFYRIQAGRQTEVGRLAVVH